MSTAHRKQHTWPSVIASQHMILRPSRSPHEFGNWVSLQHQVQIQDPIRGAMAPGQLGSGLGLGLGSGLGSVPMGQWRQAW